MITSDAFRPALRNCAVCKHWSRSQAVVDLYPKHDSGTLELPCMLHDRQYDKKKSNHDNGWRRGSDYCGKWEKR